MIEANALSELFNRVDTERLVLRRPVLEDVGAIFRIHGNPATNQFNPHGPMDSLDKAQESLNEWLADWDTVGVGYWTVIARDAHIISGFGGVKRMVWAEQDVLNLYYRFDPSACGGGFAKEMAGPAITMATQYCPQWPVIARIDATNKPSIQLAERVGLGLNPELSTVEYQVYS